MEDSIREFFLTYAQYPYWIYSGIVFFMLLSAFGFPLPEEVVLISAGLMAYMSSTQPHSDPSSVVNAYVLAAVALFSVIGSDWLIYFLGKKFGKRVLSWKFFSRLIKPHFITKVEGWVDKYGYFAVVLFRFTPGIRFPGHLMCGTMGLTTWKFLLVDGIAASLSVPTQILLIAHYGESILSYLAKFKYGLIAVIAIVILVIIIRKFFFKNRDIVVTSK